MARKRTIVVGDVHGMLRELKLLLKQSSYEPTTDRLVLAGDLVDRGPDSAGVVRFAREVGAECIQGNHDNKYVRYHKHETRSLEDWRYKNPIKLPKDKKEVYKSLSEADLHYLWTCPYTIELWEYNALVVHAGVLPDYPPHKQKREIYLYARYIDEETHKLRKLGEDFKQPKGSIHWTEVYNGTTDIIYGHHVQSVTEPVIRHNPQGARTIGLDTGACFGGRLTGIVLSPENPRGEFVQVQAERAWRNYESIEALK